MNSFKTFAIAGVGRFGAILLPEFAKVPGITVVALTRQSTDSSEQKKEFPAGVISKAVDYEDEASLVSALQGVDVLVCTLTSHFKEPNFQLARAAKKAGVKIFAPSEWAAPEKEGARKNPEFAVKGEVRELCKSIGLPYTVFDCGFWPEVVIPFFLLGWQFKQGKYTILGKGDTPCVFTTREDVASFVAHILTHASLSQLEWAHFDMVGDKKTLNEIVGLFDEARGTKSEVTYITEEQAYATLPKIPGLPDAVPRIAVILQVGTEEGDVDFKPRGVEMFPGWKPKSLKEVVAMLAQA